MRKALIIHNMSDAEHCIQNKLHLDALLFSTDPSVNVYLSEKYGIKCECLSEFLDNQEIIKQRLISYKIVEELLHTMDKINSPLINNQFNLNMRYFYPIYSYVGKYQYTAYVYFAAALKKIINIYKLKKLSVYNYIFNEFIATDTDMSSFMLQYFENIEIDIIKHDIVISNKYKYSYNLLKMVQDSLLINKCKIKLLKVINKNKLQIKNNRKNILIIEPLYELEMLIDNLINYNIIFYPLERDNFSGSYGINLINFQDIMKEEHFYINLLVKDIQYDINKNLNNYITKILNLAQLNKKYPLSLGVWGIDPLTGIRALIFEFLKSIKIPILGAQHGALYAETLNMQFDSFKRCDYFISYGFTQDDLKRLCPNVDIGTEILPYGKQKIVRNYSSRKSIDLLFPITNSFSMFKGGMIRILPHELLERQIKLLEYLNLLNTLKIWIKPFAFSNYENCAALGILRRFPNLNVCNHMTLNDFLGKYEPKAVLIEFPSQPLYEVLSSDVEIFFMNDPILPWEEQALEKLKRRVHYSENTEEMISMLDLYFMAKLKPKRDDSFLRHYVYRKDTGERILQLINKLVKDSCTEQNGVKR